MRRLGFIILLIFAFSMVWGQEVLAPGDIAIIGISTDTPDSYSFVALTTIPTGTIVYFTDNGVLSSGTIRGGEGTETWEATSDVLAGTVIALDGLTGLSGSGDQVIAYQGTEVSPTFIFAAQVNSNIWQTGSDDSNQSDLPPGLINGTTAVAAGSGSGPEEEFDNAWYSGALTSGTKEQLLTAIADNSNWTGDNSSYLPYTINFTVSPSGENQLPVISNITALPANPISSQTVSVSADVTDFDGTIGLVELHWGLISGSLSTTIAMSNGGSGVIYTTSADIPAQADGATVYYEIAATDDEPETTTTTEQNYVVTDPTPLAADFSASSEKIYVGQTVTFTDLTSGGTTPYTYAWDFENDSTDDSTEQNPEFTYNTAGTYTVKLVVTDQGRTFDTETKIDYIDVTTAPEALDVFFSEYIEGGSNNKAIEIFNGTGSSIDLSEFEVKLAGNGGVWGTTASPAGTLADGEVFVIYNSGSVQTILDEGDLSSTVTYFNGNDALGLFYLGSLIDVIGEQGVDSFWPVAGFSSGLLNHTLVRKPTVSEGKTDWIASAGTNTTDSEWIVYDQDTFAYLGSHTDTALPVTLSSFTATIFQNEFVNITWVTQSESNISHYNLYRDEFLIYSKQAENSTQTTSYHYLDEEITESATYTYMLESVTYDGSSDILGTYLLTVQFNQEDPHPEIPEDTNLLGNFPNPFNPNTDIFFTIEEGSRGELKIYNIKGQIVFSKTFNSGNHKYRWNAEEAESGVYLYKLKTSSYEKTSKMLLLK